MRPRLLSGMEGPRPYESPTEMTDRADARTEAGRDALSAHSGVSQRISPWRPPASQAWNRPASTVSGAAPAMRTRSKPTSRPISLTRRVALSPPPCGSSASDNRGAVLLEHHRQLTGVADAVVRVAVVH